MSGSRLLRVVLISAAVLPLTISALKCFDCYGTGPDHKECTEQRSCHGIACMMFDAGDNKTASAFCLLAMKGTKMENQKDGCWLEPDGKGKHCMCFSDFCNKLGAKSDGAQIADPMAPLLPDAEFLKQNPLVDYDTPKLDGDDDENDGAAPAPANILFPSAARQDVGTAGGNEDDDMVPVNFEDYKDTDGEKESTNKHPQNKDVDQRPNLSENKVEDGDSKQQSTEVSGSPRQPYYVLLFFPMAASWVRFFFSF
ncbi:unnamed protein product [Caenorhabditis auriculariae]|uniref:Uncharacterized protein n=1 Tax=Caenorhabditis auriculariae TaxID=2777116 RepID=A0A8S1HQZ4_9PELO|nr:unnamed protein product [Caenorhabditis auriculariae]